MKLQFLEATEPSQLEKLAQVAHGIWHEYYPTLLPREQIDYMVERFHSPATLACQIADEGYRFFLVMENDEIAGYLGLKLEANQLFISKAYLRKEHRGKGYFSQMLAFTENLAREHGLGTLYLMVNKENASSIAVYQKKGFFVARKQVIDIGHGYVMDDFVMEKACP